MQDQRALTERQSKALDCWSHGLLHLIAAFGLDRALKVAACGVLEIADNREDFNTDSVQASERSLVAAGE